MKAKRTISVEKIIEGEELDIEDIKIVGNKYIVKITNHRRCEKGEESLVLDFNSRDYTIIIDNKGVRFERGCYRPNHDHNDVQSLQIGVNEKIPGVEKGELIWRSRFPYKGEGYEHFYIPFGFVKET